LLPLVELLGLLLLLLLVALLYRRRGAHQGMRLLHRRPGRLLLLRGPVGLLIAVRLRHAIQRGLHVAVLRLRSSLLLIDSRLRLRHLPNLIVIVAVSRRKRPESVL
jgi:hypothetical protein